VTTTTGISLPGQLNAELTQKTCRNRGFVMFIAIENRPLTGDLLSRLSAGAVKLLMAVRAEPNESQARYVELVGLCERSVRNFGHELLDLELVCRTTSQRVDRQIRTAPKLTRRTRRQTVVETNTSEFVESDFGQAEAQSNADIWLIDLSEAQQDCYIFLRSKGIEPRGAHDLAQHCDRVMINAAVAYSYNRHPNSTPAYLVWCLKNSEKWYQLPVGPAAATQPVTVVPEPKECVEAAATDGTPDVQPVLVANDQSMQTDAAVITVPDVGSSVQLVAQLETRDTLLLAYAVEAATGVDVRLNEDARQTVEQLQQSHYTAEDVAVFADDVFPRHDWRGQKGEQPTLQALRQGVASVRHQLHAAQSKQDGVLYRVQAIRRYSPLEIVPIVALSDLWSKQVKAAVAAEARAADYCSTCDLPWSMCRCEETPLCLDPAAHWWPAMIGQLKVQLNKATFETWLASLRLIGFEAADVGDRFIAEGAHEYQRDWLTTNVLASMVETLSRLHYDVQSSDKQVIIELCISGKS
jgi:hypothetical protein